MQKLALRIGPEDDGRPMSLDEFDRVEGQPGFVYELSRGEITVMEVPNLRHFAQVDAIHEILSRYRASQRSQSHRIAHGSDCKVIVAGFESERHPDVAIYKNPPTDEKNLWATWVPEIVMEVVSSESRHRDYEEKPQEYLQFGISEYWIIDADKGKMVVFKRIGGQWSEKTIKPPRIYKTGLLPGLEFSCKKVFDAAEAVGK
jgi:Uma2 family endonuclease